LSAWGVTQTKSRFKAAVVGGGVSDWEVMVMESGLPELEVRLLFVNVMESQYAEQGPHAGSDWPKFTLGSPR